MKKFLLTNDDGIDAPGLEALVSALKRLGRVVVVAPPHELSGCSHRATTHQPLQLRPVGDDRWVLHPGTPVDCTRVGLCVQFPDVDWVVAGINNGGNLGADVYNSGTVAAAREAVLLGKSAIAVSHYRRRGMPIDWEAAARWTEAVVDELISRPQAPGHLWNVNLPHLGDPAPRQMPPVEFCPLDPCPLPVEFEQRDGQLHYCGDYHRRARQPGCDVDQCFSGKIAVTHLAVALRPA